MPRMHQCHYPTCHRLIPTSQYYCAEHSLSVKRARSQGSSLKQKIHNRQYNRERYNQTNAQYTVFYKSDAWRKTRAYVIARANGLCENCLKRGRVRPGKVVDHIKPLKQHWELRLDVTNLQLLCQTCHNRKTKAEKWMAIKAKKKAESHE